MASSSASSSSKSEILSMPTSARSSSASKQSHSRRKLLKGFPLPPPLEMAALASASEHSPATPVLSRIGFVRGRRPDGPAVLASGIC